MVDMVDIDDFLPEVLQYAPGVSDPVAFRHIIAVARELCERCKIWRETVTITITAPSGQGLSVIDNAEIDTIEHATIDGNPLEPVTVPWLDAKYPTWQTSTDEGVAKYITQTEEDTMAVYPRQFADVSVRLILKPARNVTELPALLLRSYAEEIGRGAAARLLALPTDAANPQLALDHRAWFQARLGELSVKVTRGQQNAPLRTKMRDF
jgi:hypothetical protein